MNNDACVNFRRRGCDGTLKLRGIIDIFEASALHTTVLRIMHDNKITNVHLNLAETERLDISAVQILLAFKAASMSTGRGFQTISPSETVSQQLSRIGVAL